VIRQIASLPFLAHSPSLLEYRTIAGSAWIAYDGRHWRVSVDQHPWDSRPFKSRDEAALLIAEAFQQARGN
jgi:hypothetical protein